MNWLARKMIGIAVAAMAVPSAAQMGGSDGARFIEKLREGDNAAALAIIESKPQLVDAQDGRGETALLISVKRRDPAWTAHLIRAGADPNHSARNGDTPLIVAVRAGFEEGARWLLQAGAKVDGANKMGETALIIAVQNRDLSLVRQLLANGADPDRADTAAGYSALDYARRDTRSRELLAAIEASKRSSASKVNRESTQSLDDFKLN